MKTSKQSSIYRNQSSCIRAIFDRAQSSRKVLCVALDYAKTKHVALICDGNGEILKKPFPVENSPEGVSFLLDQIAATARRRKIPDQQIFLGGEDTPSYVDNFIHAISSEGLLVARVNAWEAKENRENHLASTDELDLLGIAKTLVSRRARTARDPREINDGVYAQIRDLTRSRRQLVRQKTAASNRIHTLVDRLFPGFLESSKSGVTAFGPASLALMKDRFSAPQIARRQPRALASLLRRNRVRYCEQQAGKLLSLAGSTLAPDPNRIHSLQQALIATVDLYECLDRNIAQLETEAATLLASTPYAMLTSIGGFGLNLASGWAGELGDPARLGRTDSLCGYSGVVPRTAQTGGPDKPARQGRTSKRCNRILKDWVVQTAGQVAQYGPEEWKQRHTRWVASGQHARFAGARRLLRMARTLLNHQVPWMDAAARAPDASTEVRAAAAESVWGLLVRKWRVLPNWEHEVFSPDRPLGFWRKLAVELHGAYLPLPGDDCENEFSKPYQEARSEVLEDA